MAPILVWCGYVCFISDAQARSAAMSTAPTYAVTANGRYALNIPKYLKKDSTLNTEASLQYSNDDKEVYLIVIDELKEEFRKTFTEMGEYDANKSVIENYSRAQMEAFRAGAKELVYESKLRVLQTLSGTAIVYDVTSTQEGIADTMGFTVAFTEGKENMYMIMMWTYAKHHNLYKSDIDNAIMSFEELKGGPDVTPMPWCSDNCFMRIPRSMFEDTSLSESGICEYADYDRELYVIIGEELKARWTESYALVDHKKYKTLLDYYAEVQMEGYKGHFPYDEATGQMTSGQANGNEYRECFMFGKETKDGVVCRENYRFVETPTFLYILDAWTPATRYSDNKADIAMMFNSFNDL